MVGTKQDWWANLATCSQMIPNRWRAWSVQKKMGCGLFLILTEKGSRQEPKEKSQTVDKWLRSPPMSTKQRYLMADSMLITVVFHRCLFILMKLAGKESKER